MGYELIDQADMSFITSLNKENASIVGKKSITLPLGEIKIKRKIRQKFKPATWKFFILIWALYFWSVVCVRVVGVLLFFLFFWMLEVIFEFLV